MYLKRLELQGFKSFADKTILEFMPGITSVIGPNGSGKSNISDAIRWILGEQSMKSLRGSKSLDIIFSGTQNRKSLGFAEGSLVFDNTDGTLPIEYTEVTITRKLYRSGETGYYINKVPCRLKDVLELFMDTGIGKDGYSIIGQGKIDEILSNKSEDRRNIFEEAAGIVKYRTRKQESEKKLERTKLNLLRINDILSEIESNIKAVMDYFTTHGYSNGENFYSDTDIMDMRVSLAGRGDAVKIDSEVYTGCTHIEFMMEKYFPEMTLSEYRMLSIKDIGNMLSTVNETEQALDETELVPDETRV